MYICFVDFEKAFESVQRSTLWKIMESYGIPPKLVRMVNAMYDGSQCAVVNGTGQTDWFDVKSGVKQGCNMSGFLFLLVINWIMRRTVEGANTGIRWKLWSKLDDIMILLLHSVQRVKSNGKWRISISTNSKATGLKINSKKTKLFRLSTTSNETVQVDEQDIKDIEFCVLGCKHQHVRGHGGGHKSKTRKSKDCI